MVSRPTPGKSEPQRGPFLHEGKPNMLTHPKTKPLPPEEQAKYHLTLTPDLVEF